METPPIKRRFRKSEWSISAALIWNCHFKVRKKLQLIGIGSKLVFIANNTPRAFKHAASAVIWIVLLAVRALGYVSNKAELPQSFGFTLHTLSRFKFFTLWLSNQLCPVETRERQPSPRSSSATACCFQALWRTPAGRATRPPASLHVTAPPMARGPARHPTASVRTSLLYIICATVIPLV